MFWGSDSHKRILVCGALLSAPLFAFAQDPSLKTNVPVSLPSSSEKSEKSEIIFICFREGLPAENIVLQGPFGELHTDKDGVARISAEPSTLKIYLPELQKHIDVKAVAGQQSQVVIKLLKSKPDSVPQIDVPRIDPSNDKQNVVVPTDNVLVRLKDETIQKGELEDVIVLAPKVQGSVSALVEFRRSTSAVTDVLGSEQMARAGDSDAATSLRRVTGLTLVGGKFVFIRGLGDRYTGVQFNGFALPSPEPTRRVVPLDLFPTSILENIVVQKSYSPDLSGEFGGGIIQLKSRSLPDKFFFRAQLAQTLIDGSNSPGYRGGGLDWLGMDDGRRRMPGEIREVFMQGRKLERNKPGVDNGVSEEELVRMGQSLDNNYDIVSSNNTPLPSFNVATGNRWKFGELELGTAASALYNQSLDWVKRENYSYIIGSGGKMESDMQRTTEFTDLETKLGSTLDMGLKYQKSHEVIFTTTVLRHTNRFTQKETRKVTGDSNVYLTDTLDWTERKLQAYQLKLNNEWSGLLTKKVQTNLRLGQSNATRVNPDRRDISFTEAMGTRRLRSGSEGNRRTYSDLEDSSQEVGLDVRMPFVNSSAREWISFKVGAASLTKNRRSDMYRLYFNPEFNQSNAPVAPDAKASEHFARQNIGPGKYMLQNLTDAADSYRGTQRVFANYQMVQLDPDEQWTLQAGLRSENSIQEVKTIFYLNPDLPNSQTTVKMNNVLPAYALIYKPTSSIRGRIAYSETVARPDFRELSDVMFIDDETGNNVLGNPNLQGTVIRNVDHRWEYYYSSDEFSSLGFFYKHFTNPIEVTYLSGVNRIQSFENSKSATNYGVELENRVGLRHLHRDFRRWTVVSNVAFIDSKIELSDNNMSVQTSSTRPLQGQSPYIVNLQLLYDRPLAGFNGGLLYNIVGRRIVEVGTNGIPDTYELPYPELDFVASQKLTQNLRVNFRARNILDPDIEFVKEANIVQTFKRGTFMTVGLNAVF